MPSAFISYSRRDKGFVERLHAALTAREFEVWVDWEDIPPSAQWHDEIRAGLLASDGVVFVISPDSAASEVCGQELEHAAVQNKRIVPVVHRDPGSTPVPELAANLNWVFMRDEDDFEEGLDKLVTALETDLDHVRLHTRLGVEAERWQASGRDRSHLLRGAELTEAEGWLVAAGAKEPQPTQRQREFLLASRQSATRRQRIVIGAVSLALVVAIGLGVLALIQRSDAISARNLAQAATHAKEAQLLDTKAENADITDDPQTAVQYAVQATQHASNTDVEDALRSALQQSYLRIRFIFPGAQSAPNEIWSPDGTRLLVVSPGLSARIYRPGTTAPPIVIPAPPANDQAVWDAIGNRILIGGARPAVYDADTGRLIARIPGVAFDVALSSDGTRAATTSFSPPGHIVTHVFDVATGRQLAVFHPVYDAEVTQGCIAWAPDDSVIAQCDAESATNDNAPASLDIWNPRTGRLIHSDHSPQLIASVAFSPDSTRYVWTTTNLPNLQGLHTLAAQDKVIAQTAGKDGTFVYDTRTGARVIAFAGGASAATFSPDGSEVAYATVDDDAGHVYNFQSNLDEPLVGNLAAINSIGFSSHSTFVVTAGDDGSARVYDASDGALLETLSDGDVGTVTSASFGLDDTAIATASGDGDVRLWATTTPRPTAQIKLSGPAIDVTAANFDFAGDRIIEAGLGPEATRAGAGTGGGEILDAQDLRPVAAFAMPAGYRTVAAAASRDGRLVVAIAYRDVDGHFVDGLVETFDARTGRRLATMPTPAGQSLVTANMDGAGDRLVTVYGDGDAQQWDPRTGARLQLLHGSPPEVLAAYSPNNEILATVHEPALPTTPATTLGDITIDLWNARTGRFERRLTGPALTPLSPGSTDFAPLAVAFSPNSRAIALAGAIALDGTGGPAIDAWGTADGSPIQPLLIPPLGQLPQFADSVAFSPNDDLLAAGTAAGAYVWKLKTKPSPTLQPVFQHADPSEFSLVPDGGIPGGVLVGFTQDSQTLVTVGDQVLKAWDVKQHVQLFDAFINTYGHGSLNRAGNEFVVAAGKGVAVYPCNLCGGTSQLLAVAKHYVTTVGLGPSARATFLDAG